MKKQKLYLILACLLAVLSIITIAYKSGAFTKSNNTRNLFAAFAIDDTSTVSRIFMADMFENQVLLSKTEKGWMVNNSIPADQLKVSELLATLTSLRVSQPVAESGHPSIIQMLATSSTKVEIYAIKPLFKLFGFSFFTKERLIKTYFMGDATQNSLGSFALLEGMKEPYIIYTPGFRGYVTPQFSPKPIDWYTHRIFEVKLTRILKASFMDLENPENSFSVEKSGPRTFSLFDIHNNVIQNYDTTLLINMLSEFRQRNYERLIHKISNSLKDSIIQYNLYKTISVTDVDNQTTTLELYHLMVEESSLEDNKLMGELYNQISPDRSYATINRNLENLYTIQYYHFGRQLQPLSYFLKR